MQPFLKGRERIWLPLILNPIQDWYETKTEPETTPWPLSETIVSGIMSTVSVPSYMKLTSKEMNKYLEEHMFHSQSGRSHANFMISFSKQ